MKKKNKWKLTLHDYDGREYVVICPSYNAAKQEGRLFADFFQGRSYDMEEIVK